MLVKTYYFFESWVCKEIHGLYVSMVIKHLLQFLSSDVHRASERLDNLISLGKLVHREAVFLFFFAGQLSNFVLLFRPSRQYLPSSLGY